MNLPTEVQITKKYLFQNVKWDSSNRRWYHDFGEYPFFSGEMPESTKKCIVKDEIIRETMMSYDGLERKSEIIKDLVGEFKIIDFGEDGVTGDMVFEKK